MYAQKQRHALAQRILAILAKQPGLMAWEIAKIITTQTKRSTPKHDVNSVLYSELRKDVKQNDEFAWYLNSDFVGQRPRIIEEPSFSTVAPREVNPPIPSIIQAPQPVLIQAPPTRVVHEHVAKEISVRVEAPKVLYAIAGVLLVALILVLNGQAKQGPERDLRVNDYKLPLSQDSMIIRDTVLVEVEPTLEELAKAERLDRLYREILDLERDTLEIGQSIMSMQEEFDPREFVGNRAELAYAQGRYQRVCRVLYEKQDSLSMAVALIN